MAECRVLRRLALVCAMVASAACSNDAQRSGDDGPKELTPDRTRLAWTGSYLRQDRPTSDSDVTTLRSEGESFEFSSALDEEYWEEHPGSLHVAVRWNDPQNLPGESTGHLFSLYVLDSSGDIVASSVGTDQDISTAMSVELEAPPAGKYEVLVVPNRSRGSRYEGVVLVKAQRKTQSMPDLIPRQATNFSFRVRGDAPDDEDNPSCYRLEIIEHPGLERCLRFDAVIENVGSGPFITKSDISDAVDKLVESRRAGIEPEGDAVQVLVGVDGKERKGGTGRWVIDKEHKHTHLVDLAAFELFPVKRGGPGGRLVTDVKIGFCPWDLIDKRYGEPNSTPRRFPAQSCAVPETREGSGGVIRTIGISAGWADIYPARRTIQYLDATDLADGVYDVVITVDPNGWYEEADESNNKASTRISVEGGKIACVPEPYACPEHFTPGH